MAWHQANQIWKVINSGEAKGHLGWEPLQGHPWDLHKTDYWCVTVHKNGCIQLRLSKCTKIDNTNVKFQNFSGAKPAPNPILRIDLGTPSKTPPHNPSTIKPLASSLVMAALRSRCGYYSFALWFFFYPSSFFPRLISAITDCTSAIPYFHTWCGLSANLIWALSQNYVGLYLCN